MSEDKITIQLELKTILKAIINGDNEILAEIISKLLMADYGMIKEIHQLGLQMADLDKKIEAVNNRIDLYHEGVPISPDDDEEVDLVDAD